MRREHETRKDLDQATIIMFAFRYALGRQSCAPSFVQDYIKDHVDCFTDYDLLQMANEILEQKRWHRLGDPTIDEPMWLEFREYLLDQYSGKK